MGYQLSLDNCNKAFSELMKEYIIYAPKLFKGEGTFSDTDRVRYGEITQVEEIVFDQKSHFSYKEVLLPITQTLLFFTEDEVKEANGPDKSIIIFLRSCDLNALRRLDKIYLENGFEDIYYKRIREKTKFILMGCEESFEDCFCVSMGSNQTLDYDAYLKREGSTVWIDNQTDALEDIFNQFKNEEVEVKPDYVMENLVKVKNPDNLNLDVMDAKMWEDYAQRCIACGRCNFVCPTCTCFTMQDIFYQDNGKVGERRRVWASCQVDGYTDMAGGHKLRENKGQRMRFKVMHKIYDYKKRWNETMCVGCGRCDAICPEYISFSQCINRLEDAMKEVK